jgi:DNA-binding MarR family transcriptional regulator
MTKGVAADIDPLSLERQVFFALAVTNRAVLAVYRPLLEPLGLTHPQYLVMLALWDNAKANGESLTVKDIAGLLQMDSATLSPMLKRLQAQGLIIRSRSAADERTTHVELTPKGRNLRRQALKVPPAVVERLGVELEHPHEVSPVSTPLRRLVRSTRSRTEVPRSRAPPAALGLVYAFGGTRSPGYRQWVPDPTGRTRWERQIARRQQPLAAHYSRWVRAGRLRGAADGALAGLLACLLDLSVEIVSPHGTLPAPPTDPSERDNAASDGCVTTWRLMRQHA